MSEIFAQRKARTDRVFQSVVTHIREKIGDQYDEAIGDHTCLYAIGSCGRGEMGPGSDLDPYLVRIGEQTQESSELLQRAVESGNAAAGLPPLDAQGQHAKPIDAELLIDRLGAPEDDAREEGALTKRMLLLLESRVMLGAEAHRSLIDSVLEAYWQNSDLHPTSYQPLVLVNDIVRWWRIVLLNHESRLRKLRGELEAEGSHSDEELKRRMLAERRFRSYKMRLPRCLTCFSTLTYLLALTPSDDSHVSQDHVRRMIRLRPLDRLMQVPEIAGRKLPVVDDLLETYASYLRRTETDKKELLERLQTDGRLAKELPAEGGRFTESMFKLIQDLGGGRRLHRHMVV